MNTDVLRVKVRTSVRLIQADADAFFGEEAEKVVSAMSRAMFDERLSVHTMEFWTILRHGEFSLFLEENVELLKKKIRERIVGDTEIRVDITVIGHRRRSAEIDIGGRHVLRHTTEQSYCVTFKLMV